MLDWTRNDWSMKMSESSRGEDKKLHVNNMVRALNQEVLAAASAGSQVLWCLPYSIEMP